MFGVVLEGGTLTSSAAGCCRLLVPRSSWWGVWGTGPVGVTPVRVGVVVLVPGLLDLTSLGVPLEGGSGLVGSWWGSRVGR